MAGIFISYRRDDAGGDAGRLYDRLVAQFGANRVFRDVDTIEPGDRFPREIRDKLARSDVVIALIGRKWLEVTDGRGRQRLHQPGDYLRMELALAFQHGIPVVPALLANTPMPPPDALPADLRPLSHCQALEIDDATFHDDVTRLITAIEPRIGPADPSTPKLRRLRAMPMALSVVGLAAILAAMAVLVPRLSGEHIALRSSAAALTPEQVRALIIEHGFWSARTNPGGGMAHDYEQLVLVGGAVVRDGLTDLTWEQGGSQRIVQGGRAGAEAYVRALNGQRFAGYDNWRLPTLEEALSLMSAETRGEFHLDPVFDAHGAPFLWTADHDAGGRGWVVYYLDGFASVSNPTFNAYVRAVRSN
jgi:hypothetical protein